MHEFSLAAEVIKMAEREARKNNALSVTEITIEVGDFSGVEAEAFREALHILAERSILQGASLNSVKPPGKGVCHSCGLEFEKALRMSTCPQCNSFPSEIKGGTEFRVVSLLIEQDDQDDQYL
jgi:hydrogenase nickel incorporation protein HypA/HybF